MLMTSLTSEYWIVSKVNGCEGMVIDYIAIPSGPSLENNDLVLAPLANY
jgi:hypothetical protein